jgi:hypothetical protein
MLRFPLVVLTALLACTAAARAQDSPYVTHQERAIKALSEEETQGYLAGEGMGFALAAELNAYPGPRHVLQLADSLILDPVRLDAVREIFQRMQQRAARLGKEIVGLEASLDSSFAERRITSRELGTVLTELGALRGELRYAHLAAHLEVAALMSEHEIHEYQRLRGYAEGHGAMHRPEGSHE